MEKLKRIFGMLLVIAMLLVQVIPTTSVSAVSGTNNSNGTITIEGAIEGKAYSAYQILVLESYNTDKGAYTYTVVEDWADFFDEDENGVGAEYVTIDSQGYVTWNTAKQTENDMKTFAQLALVYAKANNITAIAPTMVEGTTVEFTGLNLGYYLVDSSVGALCSLTTTQPSATAKEKNTEPTVDKTVEEDSTPGEYGDENDADVGQTVNFKTTITASDGAENYKLYDIMSTGLTLDADSIKVTFGNATLVKGTDYTVSTTTTGYTFVITFAKAFTDTLKAGDQIVVTYSAVLNEDAVVGGAGNPNTTYLTYGDTTDSTNKTPEDETITYTYSFDLVKTDSSNVLLDGAVFRLYDSKDGGNVIPVVKDGDVYRVATAAEIKTIEETVANVEDRYLISVTGGKVRIEGLDGHTIYYLEEVTAPDGYNKLASRVEVAIKDANLETTMTGDTWTNGDGGVHVINENGTLLPGTGGMGTVLFITIGSLMVILFGVLLVTKLRISKMEA